MPAPRVYKTEAIVLRQRPLGDADRIVSLYTPLAGRIEAVAKGVRRPKSRIGGHVEPLAHCSLMLARGRSLDVVTQAQTIEGFGTLRDDLGLLAAGLYLAEMVDRFTEVGPGHDPDGRAYALLLWALRALDRGDDAALVCRFFEMRLLDALGYRPQLSECIACDRPLAQRDQYFAPHSGGALCHDCTAAEAGPVRPLSLRALKVLRLLQSKPYPEAARVRMPGELASELEAHLRDLVHAALDRDVRSEAFLDHLRRTSPPPASELAAPRPDMVR